MVKHLPIRLNDIALKHGKKEIFSHITASFYAGDRVAILGPNGAGKSSLLHILRRHIQPTEGTLDLPSHIRIAYVPQHPDTDKPLSGGQHTIANIMTAIDQDPDLLLLDEPTNHLDLNNKQRILNLLERFDGTAVIITHDVSLLRTWPRSLWIMEHGTLSVFHGTYDDYIRERDIIREQLHARKKMLKKEERAVTLAKQQEQHRAAESKKKGIKKYEHDTLARSAAKRRAEKTTSKIQSRLGETQEIITAELAKLHISEIIEPNFDIATIGHHKDRIQISQGAIGFNTTSLLTNISLSINPGERIAFMGPNGTGKSTLLKAIMRDPLTHTTGEWHLPPITRIGYLDQFYSSITQYKTPLDPIEQLMPRATHNEIRIILNRFLFKTNDDISTPVSALSGGERVRLVLATIAAQSPSILLLDEITNNLDLISRAHVIEVLHQYPGTFIVVSHDIEFLQALKIEQFYLVDKGTITAMYY